MPSARLPRRRFTIPGNGRFALVAGILILLALGAVACLATGGATSSERIHPTSAATAPTVPPGMAAVRTAQLPPEARQVLAAINTGGPFPHHQDGTVFANREHRLPGHATGYYREFTVDTPGAPDRGTRRIVAGAAGERFWTQDHYATFAVVLP